jgi:putative ubiquitin-RnfH superfamily antitoxin RatB of RatAB toxin-antitoxin module
METNNMVEVEVAYALPNEQKIIVVAVEAGSTIEMAIMQSGILQIFPDIDLSKQSVGVFSEPRRLTDIVSPGDRVEIYRPLCIDPKESRRKKAAAK